MTSRANIAATLHDHLCRHSWHGYTQGAGRWGDGEGVCQVWIDGAEYAVAQGDRDCSSSVIECWQKAIEGTAYEGKLNGATYTGNMRQVFVASGLFYWHPMGDGYVAQRGDIYLNERDHTAMCQSATPDMLSEFLSNEHGGIVGGAVGDQTGYESVVRKYYNYPWNGILAYNGKADPTSAKAGWVKDAKGWWWRQANGGYPASAWREIGGRWYYFNAEGYAATGWLYEKGAWYYLLPAAQGGRPECSMWTGWLKDNGSWYYLTAPSGAMAKSCTMEIGGKTYAFNSSGEMIEGSVPVDKNGALILWQ